MLKIWHTVWIYFCCKALAKRGDVLPETFAAGTCFLDVFPFCHTGNAKYVSSSRQKHLLLTETMFHVRQNWETSRKQMAKSHPEKNNGLVKLRTEKSFDSQYGKNIYRDTTFYLLSFAYIWHAATYDNAECLKPWQKEETCWKTYHDWHVARNICCGHSLHQGALFCHAGICFCLVANIFCCFEVNIWNSYICTADIHFKQMNDHQLKQLRK